MCFYISKFSIVAFITEYIIINYINLEDIISQL